MIVGRRVVLALLGISVIASGFSGSPAGADIQLRSGTQGAGGKAVAHKAGGKIVRAKDAPSARIYDTGFEAIEPTIGINKAGHLFVAAAGASPEIARSKNGGETWDSAAPKLQGQKTHLVTLDPYLYMDESTGRLFDIDLTVACSYMSYSDDGGDTWTTNPLACGRPINDHQTLFTGPPALTPTTVYDEIVYYCWNDFGAGSSCSKSVDGGVSWTGTGSPAFLGFAQGEGGSVEQCGGFHGHGVVGPDGTVYLPKEYCGQPWLGISHDEGLTWEQVQVANNTTERLGSDTSIAVDKKGNLYYAYETQDQRLHLVTSTDGGATWSRPLMVAAPGVKEVNLPTLDVGAPGKVAIGYVGSTNSPYAKCAPQCSADHYKDTTWNGYITMTVDALSKSPTFYSAPVNDPRDPFTRGRCDFDSGRCGSMLDFMDIEISPNGQPYAVYVDACLVTCPPGGPPDGQAGVVGTLAGGPSLR